MARKFLSSPRVPITDPIVGPEGRLTFSWEQFFERLEHWVTKRPSCHLAHSANQSLVTATWTILAFNAENHDNATMHDTTTNNDRVTIPNDGIYAMGFQVLFDSNAVGLRWVNLTVNAAAATPAAGEVVIGDNRAAISGFGTFCGKEGTRELSAGDILRVHAYQSSGGALNVLTSGIQSPRFWCFKVSA